MMCIHVVDVLVEYLIHLLSQNICCLGASSISMGQHARMCSQSITLSKYSNQRIMLYSQYSAMYTHIQAIIDAFNKKYYGNIIKNGNMLRKVFETKAMTTTTQLGMYMEFMGPENLQEKLKKKGVLITQKGKRIVLSPPLIISEPDIAQLENAFKTI